MTRCRENVRDEFFLPVMECGGKRSATPLWSVRSDKLKVEDHFQQHVVCESGVTATAVQDGKRLLKRPVKRASVVDRPRQQAIKPSACSNGRLGEATLPMGNKKPLPVLPEGAKRFQLKLELVDNVRVETYGIFLG
jgi:hypothetical protein